MTERVKFIGFAATALGMFMALFDVQIVAASLGDIQGGLAGSPDEVSWTQTSYLIAEVVMIPLSGWLAAAFSTRWVYTASTAGFTLMSIACGLSQSVEMLIACRVGQGFFGGALVTLAFSTGYGQFTGAKATIVPIALGLAANLAPVLGPTIGGWITTTFSWRWIFLINVVPGIIILWIVPRFVRVDRPQLHMLRGFDALSIPFIVVALGGLQYILETGASEGWFNSDKIVWSAWAVAFSAAFALYRGLTHSRPVLDFRAMANRNFALASILSFILGIGLYGFIYLLPLFLGRIRGYNAVQVGQAIAVIGVFQIVSMILVMPLMRRVDLRLLLGAGFLAFATSIVLMTPITAEWSERELLLGEALRGTAGMFVAVPISNLALMGLSADRLKMASGLFNLMRNLGGAIGIALLSTVLIESRATNEADIAVRMRSADPAVHAALERREDLLASYSSDDEVNAMRAKVLVQRIVEREATVMSFANALWAMAGSFVFGLLLVPWFKIRRTE
ncbi:DHA2 family efflux MFS transporter permease subunit [uncultured Sphingomonas sp.]|uniref:DHA2 family efflux MFS transporter permease subunit n=1 Tax=uncultured Sphingomonas sp. TaxID=158754 RepID=UPI0035CA8311